MLYSCILEPYLCLVSRMVWMKSVVGIPEGKYHYKRKFIRGSIFINEERKDNHDHSIWDLVY